MVGLLQSAKVAGLSGSVLTLISVFSLIIIGGYQATTKSSDVMNKARKAYWAFIAFLILGVLAGSTGTAYSAYGY